MVKKATKKPVKSVKAKVATKKPVKSVKAKVAKKSAKAAPKKVATLGI